MKKLIPALIVIISLIISGCVVDINNENNAQLEEKINSLEEKVVNLEEELKECKKNPTSLEGDVYGEFNETEIANESIGSDEIIDGSIGKEDVDSSEIQLRINGLCEDGLFITSVNENGSVECGEPEIPEVETSTPELGDVLKEGNDANGYDIKNVGELSGDEVDVDEVSADKIKADEICLGGDCENDWPQPTGGKEYSIVWEKKSYQKRDGSLNYRIGTYDYCALARMALYGITTAECNIYKNNEEWWIYVRYAACSVNCFNLTES